MNQTKKKRDLGSNGEMQRGGLSGFKPEFQSETNQSLNHIQRKIPREVVLGGLGRRKVLGLRGKEEKLDVKSRRQFQREKN